MRPRGASNHGLGALLDAFGRVAGENVAIDCRSAEGRYEQLDGLAAELVRRDPAVLVAAAAPASLASKRATRAVPIVSVYSADPVGLGLVSDLARPDGNVTGISALAAECSQVAADPEGGRAAIVPRRNARACDESTFAIYRRELVPAAQALGIKLDFVGVSSAAEIEPALAAVAWGGAPVRCS